MKTSLSVAMIAVAVFASRAAAQTDHVAIALQEWRPAESGFIQLCNYAAPHRIPKQRTVAELRAAPLPTPDKVFDNLYFVGSHWTNAWAITTKDGIILLDAMDNDWEAQHIIVDGLRTLGLDPATIRYVIVSHGHSDHYGGATYLKEKFGARILMSAPDWALLEQSRSKPTQAGQGAAPAQDMIVQGGQHVTLGGTSVELYATPGHTLGTLSSVFDVIDKGVRRKAILWGGSSFNFGPNHPEQLKAYIHTLEAAKERVRADDIEVLLSNHPEYDRSIDKISAFEADPRLTSPFVIGSSGVTTALDVGLQCAIATQEVWMGATPKATASPLR